jgi:hypothetical protein
MGKKKTSLQRWLAFISLCVALSLLLLLRSADADDGSNPPDRSMIIMITEVEYQWQLRLFSDNSVTCSLSIEHEGRPTDAEIQSKCTYQQYAAWKDFPACDIKNGQSAKKCNGVYLYNPSSSPVYRTVYVKLSPPTVWLSLRGCSYSGIDRYCQGKPVLVFSGEESLPNEKIIKITGKIGDQSFACNGARCAIGLDVTKAEGEKITFQAESSFGDKSIVFSAFAKVIPVEGVEKAYTVDIVSNQWLGRNPPSCSDIWQVFPESNDLPTWLKTPDNPIELKSSKTLYSLAAALIKNGLVDASACENGGLDDSSMATECGVRAARPVIQYWQNQFDQEIITVAKMDGVPANLMKNVFMRESQLWPGVYESVEEVGLGHLTANGADTTLLWNPEFYHSFCPLVLDQSYCEIGFAHLGSEQQNILKGALLNRTNATCPECEKGIDLTKADFSIHFFAETIKANCSQVSQEIWNTTNKSARDVSSYEDLWRFTLLNYNAGSGCLSYALYRTNAAKDPIDWEHVAANLTTVCQPAVKYVVDVTGGDTKMITVFSTPIPTVTPTVLKTKTPTKAWSPTPSLTPTQQ